MIQRLEDTLPSLRRTRDEQVVFVSGMVSRGLGDLEMVEIARRRVAARGVG
jgi:hypothetical protein